MYTYVCIYYLVLHNHCMHSHKHGCTLAMEYKALIGLLYFEWYFSSATVQLNSNLTLARMHLAKTRLIF